MPNFAALRNFLLQRSSKSRKPSHSQKAAKLFYLTAFLRFRITIGRNLHSGARKTHRFRASLRNRAADTRTARPGGKHPRTEFYLDKRFEEEPAESIFILSISPFSRSSCLQRCSERLCTLESPAQQCSVFCQGIRLRCCR